MIQLLDEVPITIVRFIAIEDNSDAAVHANTNSQNLRATVLDEENFHCEQQDYHEAYELADTKETDKDLESNAATVEATSVCDNSNSSYFHSASSFATI